MVSLKAFSGSSVVSASGSRKDDFIYMNEKFGVNYNLSLADVTRSIRDQSNHPAWNQKLDPGPDTGL